MIIDTTISIVALISGLTGALLSAYLGYVVRVKVTEREKKKRQQKLAHVYFIQLTDYFASDFLMKEIIHRVSAESKVKDESIALSHGIAAFLASKFSEIDQDTVAEIRTLLRPFIVVATDSIDKFLLSPTQLSELSTNTVYFYNRYITASLRLKTGLRLFESLLEQGNPKAIDASALHSLFQAYRAFSDASAILRASFRSAAAVSDDYSLKCLQRSYQALQKDVRKSFEHMTKLEKAKQIVQQTAEANIAVVRDAPQAARPSP
jgi:hypothetical protein